MNKTLGWMALPDYTSWLYNCSYDPCDHCTRPWCHGCKYQEN